MAAVNGDDAQFISCIPDHQLFEFADVVEGAVVLQKIESEVGKPGINIYGHELACTDGKDINIALFADEGVDIQDDSLVAVADGVCVRDKRGNYSFFLN